MKNRYNNFLFDKMSAFKASSVFLLIIERLTNCLGFFHVGCSYQCPRLVVHFLKTEGKEALRLRKLVWMDGVGLDLML